MGIDDWHVVSRKKHGYRSYEDDVAKISISIYVSNLPETFSAKDLFHACNKYGHVVDSFIPLKRSKEGKRFGFVKFINVSNVERLVGNLCTVWVGRYKLQANKARFGRPPLNGRNIRNSKSDDRHLGGFKEPNVRPTNGNKETRNNSFASVLKSNQPNNLSSSNMIHDSSPAIALDDDCLSANDLSCVAIGKIKDINALSNLSTCLDLPIEGLPMCAWDTPKGSLNCVPWIGTLTTCLHLVGIVRCRSEKSVVTPRKLVNHGLLKLDDEFCESSSDDEFVGDEKNNSITGDANDHVSESSFMNENIENVINEQEPLKIRYQSSFDIFLVYMGGAQKKVLRLQLILIDASFVASFSLETPWRGKEEKLHHLVELVEVLYLYPSNDRWAWLLGSSGEFSVHSARNIY
ncbi:nucleotide-binding alpha-beta plait domain-containing protein [Tanacetum coccineum]